MSERGALVLWMPLAARVQAVARRTKTAPAGSAAGSSLTRSGRVTPKGGQARKAAPRSVQAAAGRYTEPIPRAYRTSPRWYPYFVLGLFVIGEAVILLNYLSLVPGTSTFSSGSLSLSPGSLQPLAGTELLVPYYR
jgi:hypothetical protein